MRAKKPLKPKRHTASQVIRIGTKKLYEKRKYGLRGELDFRALSLEMLDFM